MQFNLTKDRGRERRPVRVGRRWLRLGGGDRGPHHKEPNGAAYLATFKPAREQGGWLRRFGAFFGVTRPPQCDACGSDQDVRGGFCVGCRAEAAGERVEYGAAS